MAYATQVSTTILITSFCFFISYQQPFDIFLSSENLLYELKKVYKKVASIL